MKKERASAAQTKKNFLSGLKVRGKIVTTVIIATPKCSSHYIIELYDHAHCTGI